MKRMRKERGRSAFKVGVGVLLVVLAAGVSIGLWSYLHSNLSQQQEGYPAQIYFPEKNALFLVPVTRYSASPITPQFLLSELEKGPSDRQTLLPVFPKGMSATVQPDGRTLDVNFLTQSPVYPWPLMVTDAVLATFKQLSQYDDVEFLLNGKKNAIAGEQQELGKESLREFQINDNLELSDPEYRSIETTKTLVYYRLKGTPYLVPVTLRIPPGSFLEGVTEAIEDNPRLPWILQSPLPPGGEILSVARPADNIIEMVVKLAGTREENSLAERALSLTFTGIPGVDYVRIRRGTALFGWRPLQKPPVSVNIEEGNGDQN